MPIAVGLVSHVPLPPGSVSGRVHAPGQGGSDSCVQTAPALEGHTFCGHLDTGRVTDPRTAQGPVCCTGALGEVGGSCGGQEAGDLLDMCCQCPSLWLCDGRGSVGTGRLRQLLSRRF